MIGEMYKVEGGMTLVPGAQWSNIVNMARREYERSSTVESTYGHNPQIRSLGNILGGTLIFLEAEVDFPAFAAAAQPPLDRGEVSNLIFGYNDVMRYTSVGNQITPEEAMAGVSV